MKKTITPGFYNDSPITINIKLENNVLSMTGEFNHGRRHGQIDMEFVHRYKEDDDERYSHLIHPSEITFNDGWNAILWLDLLDIWKQWHLNDMKPGCVHQTEWHNKKLDDHEPLISSNMAVWKHKTEHPRGLLMEPCPICGYKYGSKWNRVKIPADIVKFLEDL